VSHFDGVDRQRITRTLDARRRERVEDRIRGRRRADDDGTVFDLDLSKPSDVRALYSRVQEAAAAVCDAEIRAKKVEPSGWRAQCIRTAVAGAGRQVNDEWLAILLRGMPQQARL